MRPSAVTSLLFCCALLATTAQLASASALTPEELDFYLVQAFDSSGHAQRFELNHLGIQTRPAEDGHSVIAVLEGYPAHQAGIQRGDILLTADGAPFEPVYSLNDRQRAPDRFEATGRSISIDLRRRGETLTVDLRPVYGNLYDAYRHATTLSVQQFPSGNKTIGYIRVWALSRNTGDLISYRRLFAELERCDGIILDLRDAYGFLDRSHLSVIYRGAENLFVTDDARVPGDAGVYFSPRRPYRNPVAVLINENTRAGAELLAYQLDKLSRVVTVGQQSAGRLGSYLPADAGPSSFIYRPGEQTIDGGRLEQSGHRPERAVTYPPEQQGRVDPQFQAAFDLLMTII